MVNRTLPTRVPPSRSTSETTPWRPLLPWNGALGILILATVMLSALLGPQVVGTDPTLQNLVLRLLPPGSSAHLLGTDQLGRDMLARVIGGARVSLAISITAVVAASVFGVGTGLAAGFYPRIAGVILMRLADVIFAIPYILLALGIVVAIGPGARTVVLVLAGTRWVVFARVLYGETLVCRHTDFVLGARALGSTDVRILMRHVAPNVLNSIIVLITLELAFAIISETALTFLGVGVQPPTPSWGWMLSDGRQYLAVAWWVSTIPGLGIMITVLGFNLLGDWLRDRLAPRLTTISG